MIELNITGIPAELKQSARWVCWQLEDVTDGDKLRKNAKVPKNARTGANAQHNQPETWSTFSEAHAAHENRIDLKPDKNTVAVHDRRGIGMVLGKPFFGKDLDQCIVDGVMDPEVEAELAELNTYAEVSQSGTGVHVIGHGDAPKEGHRKDNREIYSCNRYFVMTGNVIGDYTEIRRFTPAEVKAEFDKVKGGKQEFKPLSAKLAELMTRTDFPDLSQAVQSLLTALAYENCDPSFIDAEFRKSKLFLETHWGQKFDRPDLHDSQIAKAIAWAGSHPRREESSTRSLIVIVDNEAECKALEYIWDPVLPKGKLIHFGGKSSEGKSPVTVDLLARNTSGSAWPDGTPNTWGKKHGILLNIEDSLEDTILPRYYLAGGAKGMLHYIRGIKVTKKDTAHEAMLAFDQDFGALAAYARTLAATPEGLGMIVVDPATNYCGAKKMNAEEDMRSILTPLAQLAEELGIVVITVGHLNKSESKDPLQRMMGATAFSGVARGVHMFSKDPEALDSAYHHIMSPCRGEMFESFKYHTTVVEQEFGGKKSKVVKVVWDGRSTNTAEDGLEQDGLKNKKDVKRAGEALRQFLQSGKRSAKECLTFMKDGGFDLEKLKSDRVREAAGVRSEQKTRQWWWYLPAHAELFEPPPEREKRLNEMKQNGGPDY
jgi:hypothetical protein